MSNHEFNEIAVVGMHFRGQWAKDYAAVAQPGDTYALEREPDNQFDQFAIKVLTPSGQHLGYIEADKARWVAGVMDEGVSFSAEVVRVEQRKKNFHPIVNLIEIPLIETPDAE